MILDTDHKDVGNHIQKKRYKFMIKQMQNYRLRGILVTAALSLKEKKLEGKKPQTMNSQLVYVK